MKAHLVYAFSRLRWADIIKLSDITLSKLKVRGRTHRVHLKNTQTHAHTHADVHCKHGHLSAMMNDCEASLSEEVCVKQLFFYRVETNIEDFNLRKDSDLHS